MGAPLSTVRTATLAELAEFDALIDVRSPGEFLADHIPGAINCPVLSDAERARVGSIYQQVSPFEARKLGAALVARNIADHLQSYFSTQARRFSPLIYCWRGGQRSRAMTMVLDQVGWPARQLQGGYKQYRREVLESLEQLPARLALTVLCGPTGSGKTALLEELAAAGEQVLDLEALAHHKGSVLGLDPLTPQPGQRAFESALWDRLRAFDPRRRVWIEAESRLIGKLRLPDALFASMRAAVCVRLDAPLAARVSHLSERYVSLLADRETFKQNLSRLIPLYGRKLVAQWNEMVDSGQWDTLAEQLVTLHYDPAYQRASDNLYAGSRHGRTVTLEALDEQRLRHAALYLTQQQD